MHVDTLYKDHSCVQTFTGRTPQSRRVFSSSSAGCGAAMGVCTDLLGDVGHLYHVKLRVLTGLSEHDEGRGHATQTPERLHLLAHVAVAVCTHGRKTVAVHCGTVVSDVGLLVLVTPGKSCAETALSGAMYFW